MRSQFLIVFIIVLLGAGTYWYQATAYVCPAPLGYRLGKLNEDFAISAATAKQYIIQAEQVWEKEVDRELFVYDETADFTIDFVYDERQQAADSEVDKRRELDKKQSENTELLQTVATLQAEYQTLAANYENKVQSYEQGLGEYNKAVNKYNDRGGAPADIYQQLEAERAILDQEAAALSSTAKELNDLASKINRLSDRGNVLVQDYNQEVNDYNSEFGFTREFTQGDYQGNNINVYKFSNEAEVVAVLAHEFGHALGIDHVEGESSLMYYLLEEANQSGVLSVEDKLAYYAVCGSTETPLQQLRRIIREYLSLI